MSRFVWPPGDQRRHPGLLRRHGVSPAAGPRRAVAPVAASSPSAFNPGVQPHWSGRRPPRCATARALRSGCRPGRSREPCSSLVLAAAKGSNPWACASCACRRAVARPAIRVPGSRRHPSCVLPWFFPSDRNFGRCGGVRSGGNSRHLSPPKSASGPHGRWPGEFITSPGARRSLAHDKRHGRVVSYSCEVVTGA